jgi:hypothetical protein
MPMQSHSGWTGIPWHYCDCHQKQYPVSQLRRQDGLIVCEVGFDNPQRTRSVDLRQTVIAQRLSEPTEEPELADILKQTEDNTGEYA